MRGGWYTHTMAPRFLAALALLAGFGAAELLNPTRIHLIDFATTAAGHTNYLFRGNMPRNETSFAIDELKAYMTLRTANASAPAFPADDVFIHVVRAWRVVLLVRRERRAFGR